jgi:transposase
VIVTLEQLCAYAKKSRRSIAELAQYADTSWEEMRQIANAHGILYRKRESSPLSDEEKSLFVEMFNSGSTIRAMTQKTGRSHKSIIRFIRSQRLTRDKPKGPGASLGAEKQSLMIQMIEAGATDAEIAEAVGLGTESINRYRYQLGFTHDGQRKKETQPELPPSAVNREKKTAGVDYWAKWQTRVFGDTA